MILESTFRDQWSSHWFHDDVEEWKFSIPQHEMARETKSNTLRFVSLSLARGSFRYAKAASTTAQETD